jgi:two-component system KDP operon response regulator KdpE
MSTAYRVLIIDDEAPIRRFLRASLESQGAQVLEARNGAEGLALGAPMHPM